jgi:hypothetical protein
MPPAHYPKPHGPSMKETVDLPIHPGRSGNVDVKPSTSFTYTCIPREGFERLMSEPVNLDLLPEYPQGFDYLTGPLNYTKFVGTRTSWLLRRMSWYCPGSRKTLAGSKDFPPPPTTTVADSSANIDVAQARVSSAPKRLWNFE